MVIDWRAPVSQPFYRASKTDPQDIALRRRFGYTGGELTAYEDEHLSDPAEAAAVSKLLQQEIERPRVGPMRDIVATIQPEQDEIVRSGLSGSVCVQGGPGTGKTAVGLHRVAYLLYAHRDRLARTGTLVIGPNRSFLHYIEQVLLRRWASWRSSRPPSTTWSPARVWRYTARTPPKPPWSRATPGWRRCCAARSSRTSARRPSR